MQVDRREGIAFPADRDCSASMCQHTPSSNSCESDGMVVDLSVRESQLSIELPKMSPSCKGLSCIVPVGSDFEPDNSAGGDSDLFRRPTPLEFANELGQMGSIAGPMAVLGILLYLRAMISMLFLGRLGNLELAGGALSLGFANITGISVLAGLATGMEPICAQAYGAKRWQLIGLTLQRTIMVLFCACVPIAVLWMNMQRILTLCGQDAAILAVAHLFLMFSLPDLAAQAILNPLRIYLRSQQITTPLTYCALFSVSLHVPINLLLVDYLGLHVRGVALATAWTDFNLVFFLLSYLWYSGRYKKTWEGWSLAAFREWGPLLRLAIPSCISVCLEWWWYEIMIILSGLLVDAQAAVASMGILIQTTALVYIFPSSLSLGVSTRVGNELGANRPGRARIAMFVGMVCAFFVGILACIFASSVRHIWGRMFTDDPKILAFTSLVLPIVGLCELGNCPQTTGCGVLRGSARPTVGAKVNWVAFYLVGTPVALVLGFWFRIGFLGLWLGLLAAQATCVTVMLFVLVRTDWMKQAERAKELTAQSTAKVAPSVELYDLDTNEDLSIRKSADPADAAAEEKESLISIKIAHTTPPRMAEKPAMIARADFEEEADKNHQAVGIGGFRMAQIRAKLDEEEAFIGGGAKF